MVLLKSSSVKLKRQKSEISKCHSTLGNRLQKLNKNCCVSPAILGVKAQLFLLRFPNLLCIVATYCLAQNYLGDTTFKVQFLTLLPFYTFFIDEKEGNRSVLHRLRFLANTLYTTYEL